MAGYNMGSSESPKIFSDSSIRKYLRFSRLWILNMDSLLDTENLTEEYYYLGTYIFDVNGQKYEKDADGNPFNTEIWNNLRGERYDKVRAVFDPTYKKSELVTSPVASADKSTKDDNSGVYSITQLIQLQYLSTHEKVVHLFRENDENICEILTRKNSESEIEYEYDRGACLFHYNGEPERDLPLSPIGKQHPSVIKEILDRHFDLIKQSEGAHMYFVPRVLKSLGKIINVSTIISPDSLTDGSIGVVQFGVDNASSGLMDDTVAYFNKLAIEEARKSAKAAIMSRNMSHNLGSHVMAYLKQHLCSVTNILQDNILSDLMSATSFAELLDRIEEAKTKNGSSVKFVKEVSTEEGSLALPFLVGLGHFISYLQERQDFIATVATDYIPYYSTVNFKDFIYDELNPDKRHLRHKDRKNIQPDNILLGNIARSEGLGRTISPTKGENGKLSDIVIKFRGFDGNPVVNESNVVLEGRQKAFDDLEFMRQIDVSLPGGMVGRQAIFSIIENIVRNAAKHGNWRSEGRLELTFDCIEKEEIEKVGVLVKKKRELENLLENADSTEERNKIQKSLQETIGILKEDSDGNHLSLKEVLWLFYSEAVDKDDLYYFTITDNVKTSLESVSKLREALREDYIDENGVMTDGNKGIKELRISAAWLRGGKDENDYYYPTKERIKKPQESKKAPLMYARQSNGHLQYIFCLLIPKRVAIVSDSFQSDVLLDIHAKKCLAESYWKTFTPYEYIRENNKSYNFVLCDGEHIYNLIRPYSSSRIMNMAELKGMDRDVLFSTIQNGISLAECHRIETLLYSYFAECKAGRDFICVDDKKAYARYSNLPTTIQYKWITVSEEPKTGKINGYFLRTTEGSRDEIHGDNGLFDGMRLIPGYDYCRIGQVLVTDGGGFGQYVYRTHHDMNEEFKRFMGELRNNYKGCKFVESVTGNTSTDRLVRNDSFDDRWFYSHLRAMKQHIAICDERLFAKLYGLEEVDFTRANAASGNLDEMKAQYINQFGANFAGIINKCNSIDELNKVISSNPALKKKLYKSEAKARNRAVSVDFQKGIYVYTFVKNPNNPGTYGMYGLLLEPERTDVLDAIADIDQAKTGKLLDLSWANGTLSITPYKGSQYLANAFDYISIHQGLLDKLYEAFDIKDDTLAKVELTKQLFLFLKRGDRRINDACMNNGISQLFMPGISVHSGRSKPNKNDMPQLVPFIQYAAIEHATLDCKYSLVELLDNARYE